MVENISKINLENDDFRIGKTEHSRTPRAVPNGIWSDTASKKCCNLCAEWTGFVKADCLPHSEEKDCPLGFNVPAERHRAKKRTECNVGRLESWQLMSLRIFRGRTRCDDVVEAGEDKRGAIFWATSKCLAPHSTVGNSITQSLHHGIPKWCARLDVALTDGDEKQSTLIFWCPGERHLGGFGDQKLRREDRLWCMWRTLGYQVMK